MDTGELSIRAQKRGPLASIDLKRVAKQHNLHDALHAAGRDAYCNAPGALAYSTVTSLNARVIRFISELGGTLSLGLWSYKQRA